MGILQIPLCCLPRLNANLDGLGVRPCGGTYVKALPLQDVLVWLLVFHDAAEERWPCAALWRDSTAC
jgi:hypothetical protein